MPKPKQKTRTGAAAPAATRHLDEGQKKALDVQADAEHTDGAEREKLTHEMEELADPKKPNAD